MPLWRRKYLLASIFTPKKGVIELADCVRANSSDGIKTYLERIVAERYVPLPRSLVALKGRLTSYIHDP